MLYKTQILLKNVIQKQFENELKNKPFIKI